MVTQEGWNSVHVGKVLSINNWSDTHVSSSGGGGYVGQHGGYVHAPTVHSSVVQRARLFSKSESGEEKQFDLSHIDVPFREGNNILIIYGSEVSAENGPYLYVENLDTKDFYSADIPLRIRGFIFGKAAFYGLLVGILCLFAGLWLVSMVPKSSQSYEAAQVDSDVKKIVLSCIPGSRTTEERRFNPYYSCEKGSPTGNAKKMTHWCECDDIKTVREKLISKHEVYSRNAVQTSTTQAVGAVIIVSILLGLGWIATHYTMLHTKLESAAIDARKYFINEIIEKCRSHEIGIKSSNISTIALKRA